MYPFNYHRPASVRKAATILAKEEDAKILAGGHTLLPTMKQRLASGKVDKLYSKPGKLLNIRSEIIKLCMGSISKVFVSGKMAEAAVSIAFVCNIIIAQ